MKLASGVDCFVAGKLWRLRNSCDFDTSVVKWRFDGVVVIMQIFDRIKPPILKNSNASSLTGWRHAGHYILRNENGQTNWQTDIRTNSPSAHSSVTHLSYHLETGGYISTFFSQSRPWAVALPNTFVWVTTKRHCETSFSVHDVLVTYRRRFTKYDVAWFYCFGANSNHIDHLHTTATVKDVIY